MAFNKTTKQPLKKDTSWQKVADWYKDVPKKGDSYHKVVVIPNIIEKLKQFVKPGGTVVDIACGEGTITNKIKSAGFKTVGTDMSQDLINSARHNYPTINFVKEDARNLSDGFVKSVQGCDAVVCVLALQNIDDIEPVIKSVSKMLSVGGVFIALLNHPYFRIPKVTKWAFEGFDKQNRVIEKYLSEQNIQILAHPGDPKSEVTYSFHRPLKAYIKSFGNSGMALIDMDELISTKASEPGKRANAENNARKEIPMFMTLVAKKF
jgi:ubiquinone/menaquinone biosynthesis C-methylase UbiE